MITIKNGIDHDKRIELFLKDKSEAFGSDYKTV